MTIDHSVGGGVAPVDKTVVYGTVTNILGEPSKCWITSNLGASHQADSIDDPTEASAGWYWQFDHKQGYMHDGTARIPGSVWNSSIMTNDDWGLENDPCAIELGSHWYVPTMTEWTNLENAGHWRYGQGHWYSGLKLHFAGYLLMNNSLNYNGGDLMYRGIAVNYWSKSNIGINFYGAWMLNASYNSCQLIAGSGNYPTGLPLRCVRESPVLSTISTDAVGNITGVSATSGGNITDDGGLPVTSRGVCWSLLPNPTIADSHSDDGSGTGTFPSYLNGLNPMTTYHVRAYAINNIGTAYGNDISFTTGWGCGLPLQINHQASGGVAPVNKTTSYGTVTNIPGEPAKCWITSNLGSDHQAFSVDDNTEASAGWYWQFNRKQGYKHDGVARTPNTPWITAIIENTDWEMANDPCLIELGEGWRIPLYDEWFNVDFAGNWTDWFGPWNSGLKIHAAGNLILAPNLEAILVDRGSFGHYWTQKQFNSTTGTDLIFYQMVNGFSECYVLTESKEQGKTLRCLNDFCTSYSPVDVLINESSNPVCENENVTITAIPANGGTSPSFQWKVNGINVGTNNPVFTYLPSDNDLVSCVVTSDLPCVTNNPAVSNAITLQVSSKPAITIIPCMDPVTTTDAQPFKLKYALPPGGVYSGSGVSGGIFNPNGPGVGLASVTYSYVNVYNCENSAIFNIQVSAPVPFTCGNVFTDPRDNQSYPTFPLPGGKCWMAANLNYGTFIPDNQPQSDNCSPEKYCLENLVSNCGTSGGFYQWDELMQYESGQGVQGVCPPGWHIPDSTEWRDLIMQNSGNGMAGIDLKNLLAASGFQGVPSGLYYQNHTWWASDPVNTGSVFWTSTSMNNNMSRAVARGIHHATPSVSRYHSVKTNAFQIRCVRN